MRQLEAGSRVGIVCCSNGQKESGRAALERLGDILRALGLEPVYSDYIFEREDVFSGSARERAGALMDLYRCPDIQAIFDISGGDIANEILQELDYSVIAISGKQFWGYSDLTTVLNAIYTKTGNSGVLYQIRNLLYDHGAKQLQNFRETVRDGKDSLHSLSVCFVQGDSMEGIVVGGNVRCLLKLAGTPYFPDLAGKILLLEAYSGLPAQLAAYFSQLKQMNAFERVSGVLLGTFTQWEEQLPMRVEDFILRYVGTDIPVARTGDIGHGTDAKAIEIGGMLRLAK